MVCGFNWNRIRVKEQMRLPSEGRRVAAGAEDDAAGGLCIGWGLDVALACPGAPSRARKTRGVGDVDQVDGLPDVIGLSFPVGAWDEIVEVDDEKALLGKFNDFTHARGTRQTGGLTVNSNFAGNVPWTPKKSAGRERL